MVFSVIKARLMYLRHILGRLKKGNLPCSRIESREDWSTIGVGCTCGEIYYAREKHEFRAILNMVRMRKRT